MTRDESDAGFDDLTIITQPAEKQLNQRQLLDYRNHREEMVKWCLNFGKNPEKNEGYSPRTIDNRLYRIDQFYRWTWDQRNGYTTDLTPSDADEYMQELAYSDKSNTHKANCQKSLKMLFKWRKHQFGEEQWEPEMTFSSDNSQPRDYFTMEERRKLREAALEYGSIPGYNDLTPKERDKWKAHLAQRFEKPKSEVTPRDWKKANGWKIPSMVWVSLDAGLRPVEVERAVTSWVDIDNAVLRIPKEDSSKNRDNWIVGLQDRTAEILNRWLNERRYHEKYDDSDKIWLTRQANPYQTQSLRYVINRLCEIAGIDTENRKISWYAIRHSVGTYMTHIEDLGAAQAQLRHKSEKTTMRYDQAPVEERKNALDKMG
jgi:integrase